MAAARRTATPGDPPTVHVPVTPTPETPPPRSTVPASITTSSISRRALRGSASRPVWTGRAGRGDEGAGGPAQVPSSTTAGWASRRRARRRPRDRDLLDSTHDRPGATTTAAVTTTTAGASSNDAAARTTTVASWVRRRRSRRRCARARPASRSGTGSAPADRLVVCRAGPTGRHGRGSAPVDHEPPDPRAAPAATECGRRIAITPARGTGGRHHCSGRCPGRRARRSGAGRAERRLRSPPTKRPTTTRAIRTGHPAAPGSTTGWRSTARSPGAPGRSARAAELDRALPGPTERSRSSFGRGAGHYVDGDG